MQDQEYKEKASKIADELQEYINNSEKYKWEVAKETRGFSVPVKLQTDLIPLLDDLSQMLKIGSKLPLQTQNGCFKHKKDYKISCVKSEYFSGHLYKCEAEYNVPPKTVFEYVEPLPDGPRQKWDKNMKKIEVLKWIDKDLRINRACTASACMGLISPRDFVDLILVKETDTYYSTNAVSCECPEFPEEKKFVRGWNYPCGIVVIKNANNPNKCKLVSLIQPDIKGMVPKNLTDAAIPGSMTEFFNNLTAALKEDGKFAS